jgi:signal peptidase II
VLLQTALLLVASGAVGNMIDRIRNQYVIDFFYVKAIDFPVFNVADIYVTVGAFLLIIALLFVYEEKELSFWKLFSK